MKRTGAAAQNSCRLRSTLAVAPVFFTHAVVTVVKIRTSATLNKRCVESVDSREQTVRAWLQPDHFRVTATKQYVCTNTKFGPSSAPKFAHLPSASRCAAIAQCECDPSAVSAKPAHQRSLDCLHLHCHLNHCVFLVAHHPALGPPAQNCTVCAASAPRPNDQPCNSQQASFNATPQTRSLC